MSKIVLVYTDELQVEVGQTGCTKLFFNFLRYNSLSMIMTRRPWFMLDWSILLPKYKTSIDLASVAHTRF